MTTSERIQDAISTPPPESAIAWDVELDQFVVRLEKAYAQRSDPAVAVEILNHAPTQDHPRYAEIVRELIRVDMELSAAGGQVRGVDYYRLQFGPLLDAASICHELNFEQQRLEQESNSAANSSSAHPPTEFPQVGQELCGFQLQSELGRGSFGRVYLALESGLSNRRVVLKVSSQFPGEAELLARLQHKNIVPIYSLHQHQRWHVVCMPMLGTTTLSGLLRAFARKGHAPTSGVALVDTIRNCASETLGNDQLHQASPHQASSPLANSPSGSVQSPSDQIDDSLLQRLRQRFDRFSYGQAVLWLVAQLADGLSHAHERNILHRDIKPANVLLSDDGLPMLLDFNLALENEVDYSKSHVFGGTPRYMSPEQMREVISNSRLSDPRSDIFSLGVVLYELLTLRPPFQDRSGVGRDALQRMVVDRQLLPKLTMDKASGITSGIVAIVHRALQFNPIERYQSAQEFLEDLNCELNHQPLKHAVGERVTDRLRKWNQRHPRLSATTLVASAATVVLFAASLGLYSQNQRVQHLRAINWLSDAAGARGVAQGLVSSVELPTTQIQAMIESCDTAIQKQQEFNPQQLSQVQAKESRQLLAQLLLLRARGKARLAARQIDRELAKQMLESSALDAQQSASTSTEYAAVAEALIAAIHRNPEQSNSEKGQGRGVGGDLLAVSSALSTELKLTPEQLDQAIATMKSSLATDATNPWFWTNLAQLQMDALDRESARASLQVALDLDSKLPWPSLLLGTMELDRNRFSEAKSFLNQTIQLDKQAVDAYLNRALANIGMGDLEAALEDLNDIESYAASNPRILFIREIVHRRLGKATEADRDRDAAMALQPRDARSWNARGEARLRVNPPDREGALEDFRQASLTSPSLRNSYENMAHVLSEYLNRPDEAIAALDIAIECDPSYALARSSRSVLHARRGNVDAAIADVQSALALERTAMICYQAASAYALVRRDDSDEQLALNLLKETVRQNPVLATMMSSDPDLKKIKDQKTLKQIIVAASHLK